MAKARSALGHDAEVAVTAAFAIFERVDTHFFMHPAAGRALTVEENAMVQLRRRAMAAMRYLRDRADSALDAGSGLLDRRG